MSLSDFCHHCHNMQFTEIAAIADPECVGCVQSQDDCGACNIVLDGIPKSMGEELLVVLSTGFIVCPKCESCIFFPATMLFKCKECTNHYLDKITKYATIISEKRSVYCIDLDKAFGLTEYIMDCFENHAQKITI